MKKYMMMAALAAATVGLFTSCSEEEIVKVSAQTGEPIRFAATARVAGTRTVYGDKVENQWPLYWVDGDKVVVNCPQAQAIEGKTNTATYTVSDADGTNDVYTVQGEGLYWGAEDTHNFYEAYPAANVQEIKDGVLTATMPETQTPTLVNGYYVDMNAALMAGATSCSRSSIDAGGVELPFEPIFTAVDITISASPNQDFELKSITVANISTEANPAPVAGSFTYNYATQEYTTVDVKNNVQMEFDTPITLVGGSEDEVKATIFIRGDYKKAVKVQLNGKLDDALTLLAKEGNPEVTAHLLKPSMRNHIVLGALPEKQQTTPPGAPLGSNWMAFEKNSTPVSWMSIPGSFDSGNLVEGTDGDWRSQTNSVSQALLDKYNGKENVPGWEVLFYHLNNGIRAFDLRMRWDDTYGFFVNNHQTNSSSYASNTQATKLREFLPNVTSWLKQHTTEFVVIFLQASPRINMSSRRYPAPDNALSNTFDSKIKSEITTILAGEEAYYLDEYNPDITVNEARGKILFVTVSNNATMDYVGMRIPRWSSNTNSVQTCGSFSVFDYVENDGTAIRNSRHNHMKAASDNSDKSKWFVTGLNPYTNKGSNSTAINTAATTYVKGLDKCGIVLGAYVCTEQQKGAELTDAIWQLNFK